jgi:nicotinamide riboside kinase
MSKRKTQAPAAHPEAVHPAYIGDMKCVVIIGRGASGKSTLAVSLGEITGLPAIKNQEAKRNEQKTPRPTLA